MTSVFEFVAESRAKGGKVVARGVRRNGQVPAVIYGGNAEPKMLVLSHNEVVKRLNHEAVYSHVLDVVVDGKTEKAILKGVQRNPAKFQIMHLDFLRVDLAEPVKVHVPLHFINEQRSVGCKKGGVATHSMVDVEVLCLPSQLPEFIEVDLLNLDIGESVHLSQLEMPKGVEIVALSHGPEHDIAVVSILSPGGSVQAEGSSEEALPGE